VKPNVLSSETLLVREARSSTQQVADRALRAAGVEPKRVWELDSSEAIKRAAREGLGIAFVSHYAVAEEVERGELECFRLAGQPRIERRFHIARLARRSPSPSERRFMATVTRCARAPITQPRSWARSACPRWRHTLGCASVPVARKAFGGYRQLCSRGIDPRSRQGLAAKGVGHRAFELLAGHLANPLRDSPAVAERIGDLPVQLTPERFLQGLTDFRTARQRPLPDGTRVVAGEVEDGRCTANAQRREDVHLGEFVGEHHGRVAEAESCLHEPPVRDGEPVLLACSKDLGVPTYCSGSITDDDVCRDCGDGGARIGVVHEIAPLLFAVALAGAAGSSSIRVRLSDPRSDQRVKLVGEYQYSVVTEATSRRDAARMGQRSGMSPNTVLPARQNRSVLVVITGPIASGKSTLARAVARELEAHGVNAATVDLDLVYELFDPTGAPKTDPAKWTLARRVSARLADALLAEGVGVIVEGEFLTAAERAEFEQALTSGDAPQFVNLRVPLELALQRAQRDPTRGLSRDPVFLRAHYEATAAAVRDAPSTDLALDTGVLAVSEAARTVAEWVFQDHGAGDEAI
jgi:adenylylsulfate kinase-like enzyme